MDGWLAGFTDGEGCFMLALKRQGRPGTGYHIVGVQPWFSIGLRHDDGPLLLELADAFGGRVRLQKRPSGPGQGRRQDRRIWTVSAMDDLRQLVAYFDANPLRSKKARDYAVWREAVLIYVVHGARHPDLPGLRERLIAVRS